LPFLLGTLLAAASVGACRQRDDVADGFPDGACVNFDAPADGDHQQIGNADCSGPHTHVVLSWVGRDATCPAGSDAEFGTPDGKLCLRAEPGPSASP
jgi:hypothetical protein